MVLLLNKIELKEEFLNGELIRFNELLSSLEDQHGYCAHSVNIDLKRKEQLLLIVEWENEVAAKNYLQAEEFKLLVETTNKVGKKCSSSLAGVLSHGEIQIVCQQMRPPPVFEPSHE